MKTANKFLRVVPMLALTCILALSVLAAHGESLPKSELSNKWRIKVNHGADSDGTIVFRVTRENGQPEEVTVTIKKGRGENNIALDIKNALKAALTTYHVERDDWEDVLVKRKGGPNFALVLVSCSVQGPSIRIKKE